MEIKVKTMVRYGVGWREPEQLQNFGAFFDPLYMHEYGHTFDSRIFGLSYLFVVGVPSAVSAAGAKQVLGETPGVTTHDFRWYEMRANRHAAGYFGKYYGVDWNAPYNRFTIETFYPRRRR